MSVLTSDPIGCAREPEIEFFIATHGDSGRTPRGVFCVAEEPAGWHGRWVLQARRAYGLGVQPETDSAGSWG